MLTFGFIGVLLNWVKTKLIFNFANTKSIPMERIKLHDKNFRLVIKNEEIEQSIKTVADQLNNDFKNVERPLFLAILNGSFMFAASLLKNIDFECEIAFVRLSSYNGTSSSGKVKHILGFDKPLEGRNVIIVEDIIDSGETIEEINKILYEANVKDKKICTMLLKPDAVKKDLKIDYAAMRIPNDFIVGFGLDYNELGRQYRDIYILEQ